ncbi:NAD(P)H-hydrate epimerase [Achromobacter sp. UMC71]|uniref:NAD(P)H-hydrate epimerase n=1 Tax=Achromobacter sp. UMC71 TaxID=1862320 RepID=UPI00160479F9|nr:NAD(P)H-hydrate epimerase [Achromobacter sp. UMC71]MBB1625524.1 NAD(P)H-hydrate epimerase [Achromobacter sp. UMC71]
MPSFSVARIRHAERLALSQGRELMPLAGLAAADFIAARFAPPARVLALAGPGNNGGDALTAATGLLARGYAVDLHMPAGPDALPPDAARAWRNWRDAGGGSLDALPDLLDYAVIIDGLFGIGLNRPLGASWQTLADRVNASGAPVLALDVPSGIDADSGLALGRPLRARWTLCFIAMARGLEAPGAGREAAGECLVRDLGVTIPPPSATD